MDDATWGEGVAAPKIDWRMRASFQDVPQGGSDVAEVTNLEQ